MIVTAVPRSAPPATRRDRARALLAATLALSLLPAPLPGGVVAAGTAPRPGVTVSTGIDGPGAAQVFRMNLGERRDFVAQANFVQCVGASVQMMLNVMRPGADRSAATQARLQRLARGWSGPRPDGTSRKGAGIRGWEASLEIRGGGPYRIVGKKTLQEALRAAALAIRTYHRPVGLLVWRGRHAWVMTGFEATADPASGRPFTVTRAYILDPLYPHGSAAWGPSPRPGAAVDVSVIGRQFVRRRTGGPWNALPGMARLAGKYVLLVPSGPDPTRLA